MLSLPGFLYGITDNLGGLADTLLISVGIHPQCHGFAAAAQGLRHTGHIRTIGNGDAGESVPKLVGMENEAILVEVEKGTWYNLLKGYGLHHSPFRIREMLSWHEKAESILN